MAYEVELELFRDPRDLSPSAARSRFDALMAARPLRTRNLADLLAESGLTLSSSDADIQSLNDWYREQVRPSDDVPGTMSPLWRSITHDLAFYLGDQMIARFPRFHWELFRWGRRNVAYNQAVIMGLDSPNPKANIDIDRMALAYGNRLVSQISPKVYEDVSVRGVVIPVNEIAKRHNEKPPTDEFLQWMMVARDYAGQGLNRDAR